MTKCYTLEMEGGCHCQAIRFKTITDPYWIGACYCSDCRKISGSPYIVYAGFNAGEVVLLKGVLGTYQSSEKVQRSFCPICHSPFSFTYKTNPEEHFIPVGIFDDPSTLAPQKHIFVAKKLPWITIHDEYPQEL